MSDSLWAIRCVWLRYFDVFRKNMFYGLLTTYSEPVLYLLSFGFGLGSMIGTIEAGSEQVTYRKFVLAGIVAQSVLFQGFFEAAYGSFVRMYYQKIFQAMSVTPITLSEVLWGELLWDASKGTFSASAVLLIGVALGDFSLPGALACLPLCFLGAFMFGSLGLLVASLSRTIEDISYPQYLLVFPMFLFCGIYFPLSRLPHAVQQIAAFLPLTSLVSLIRYLTIGFPFEPYSAPLLLFWLFTLCTVSRLMMKRRLIK